MSHPTIKILVTLGPKSFAPDIIRAMDGLDIHVFRINLSHTELDEVEELIDLIRGATGTPICLDTEGAQLRTRRFSNGRVRLAEREPIFIPFNGATGNERRLPLYPPNAARLLEEGDVLDIDFHGARLRIDRRMSDGWQGTVIQGGWSGSNKAVSLERTVLLPSLTDKDRQAVALGAARGVRDFALSFASTAEDIEGLRKLAGSGSRIICKIESLQGVRNLDAIADAADALLIDRGDLSREAPIAAIPFLQRHIVATARRRGKPVFVATNLLESMVGARSPSRAEVNDIVSTLEMGAQGLVLAAETAIGDYPFECVQMARQLIDRYARWTWKHDVDEILADGALSGGQE